MSYSEKCKIKFLDIDGGDIPDEKYFKIPGISNSKLKLINPVEGGSPEMYQEGFKYSYNPSLALGTAVHCNLLQQDEFLLSDYEGKPSGKCGYFIDKVYYYRQKGKTIKEAIDIASKQAEYYVDKLTSNILRKAMSSGLDYYLKLVHKDFIVDGKEALVLPKKYLDTAKKCIRSIDKNADIQNILKQGVFEEKEYYNEIALFTNIQVTFPNGDTIVIPFKGKLDSVVIDNNVKRVYLNDVKTTSKPLEYFMDAIIDGEVYIGTLSHHHYARQLACYAIMLQMYCNYKLYKADYSMECNIFAVETANDTHRSQRFRINQAYVDEGIREFKDLICRVAYHEKYGYDKLFPDSDIGE